MNKDYAQRRKQRLADRMRSASDPAEAARLAVTLYNGYYKSAVRQDADSDTKEPAAWMTTENNHKVPLDENGVAIGGGGGTLEGVDFSDAEASPASRESSQTGTPQSKGKANLKTNGATIKGQYRQAAAMNEYDFYEEKEEAYRKNAIQQETGFDEAKTDEVLTAMCGTRKGWLPTSAEGETRFQKSWFFGGDTDIRNATDEDSTAKAETINEYIHAAPKFEGTIYRGLALSDDEINQIVKSGTFKEAGKLSSWTSSGDVASMFAEGRGEEYGKKPVIIQTENHSMAVPVGHLSIFGGEEDEVLVSNFDNDAYDVANCNVVNGVTYITLRQAGGE